MDSVFFVFEIIGVIAFAISGATVAIKSKMDILGVAVLGLTTSVGGGIIRDLLLGITPPSMLLTPLPALIAISVSLVTFLPFIQKCISKKHKLTHCVIMFADAVGLGFFTIMGTNTVFTIIDSPNLFICVTIGVITGVGGGVLRDVLSKNTPQIFVKNFYATASIIGALIYSILYPLINNILAMSISISLIVILRILAIKFRLELPKANCLE